MKEILGKIKFRRLLNYALYLFLTLVVQDMVLNQIRPLGVAAMVLPAAVVAVAMFEGATTGSIFALILGVFADMAMVENTVGFTLLFPALAFATGFISQFFINRRFFAYMGVTFAALLITAAFQAIRIVVSEGFSGVIVTTVVLQTLWSMPLAVLAYYPPAKWID